MDRREFIKTTTLAGMALAVPANFSLAAEPEKERQIFTLSKEVFEGIATKDSYYAYNDFGKVIITHTRTETRYSGIVGKKGNSENSVDYGITVINFSEPGYKPLKILSVNRTLSNVGTITCTHGSIHKGMRSYYGYAKFDKETYNDCEQIKVSPFYDTEGNISFYLVTEFIYKNVLTSSET